MNKLFQQFLTNAKNKKENLFSESFAPLEGIFKLQLINKDGSIEKEIEDKNLIVLNSFEILANLLSNKAINGGALGVPLTDKVIDTIGLGDQGIVDGTIIPPMNSDVTLRNETFRNSTLLTQVQIETVLERSITFHFTIDENTGNGGGAAIYNEAGLFTNDGSLFSRKVFTEIVKTVDQKIFIQWKILWKIGNEG